MSAKGNVRVPTDFKEWDKHYGFVQITRVVAVNPTIEERNDLYGIEHTPNDEEIVYVAKTDDGKEKVRIDFYYETSNPALGIKRHSSFLTNMPAKNKDGSKVQVVNVVGNCSWVPLDEDDNPDFSTLKDWFINFTNKKTKEVLGKKDVRVALKGEERLMNFLRAILNLRWNEPGAELLYNYKRIFKGDIKEIKSDVMNEEITQPFVGLLYVSTSEDGEKQYENLYDKTFLPKHFLACINNGETFVGAYDKKLWKDFLEEVRDENWGLKGFYELVPATLYDKDADISTENGTKANNPTDSSYGKQEGL